MWIDIKAANEVYTLMEGQGMHMGQAHDCMHITTGG